MTSAIANGGSVYKPLLVKDSRPLISGRLNISPGNLEAIRRGLFGVVNEPGGTGWAAKSDLVTVAGKTGTAQVITQKNASRYVGEQFRDHAWFVAFAPVEKPEIALAVLVEHGGHGGGAAAPIAKSAIEAYVKSMHSLDR
jgi:penicillin-binding protein 2